jgi:hypothetical protein
MALNDTVLLKGERRRELAPDAEVSAVLDEVSGGELTTTICPKRQELLAGLPLRHRLDTLDGICSGVLCGKETHPHVAGVVLHEK